MTGYYYYCWDSELTHEICQKLIKLGEGKWKQAQTFGSENENIEHDLSISRKSDVVWIEEQWVYNLIWEFMLAANERAGWKYEITAAESPQLTRYKETEFYAWHADGIGSHNDVYHEPDNKFRHGNTRKLSMSIILNSDFEGGDFEIRDLDDENKVPKLQEGSVIVFPSFINHRVTPVTEGTRYSLVSWFIGSPFK